MSPLPRALEPQTNGTVERFERRASSEILATTVWSHQQLEWLLRGFNAAHNARWHRVLAGKAPNRAVVERPEARRELANARPRGRAETADVV